jgi:erythromycin esterase
VSRAGVNNEGIRAWLQGAAVPLTSDDPTSAPDDLAPLQEVLQEVSVVGLGEATHGTREFFRMRHRVLRFLIETLGFDTLAIEGSYSAAERLNAYVSGSAGDVRRLLADLHLFWNIEEFVAVVEWIRLYNEQSPPKTIRFCGLDIYDTRPGREWLTAYAHKAFPNRLPKLDEIFRDLQQAEAGGWLAAHEHARLDAFDELTDLLTQIDRHADDGEEAARHLRVVQQWVSVLILQWVSVRLGGSLPPLTPSLTPLGVLARTRYLGENLTAIRERKPGAKIAVWAHNLHVAKRYEDPQFGAIPTMGHYLEERLGDAYYSVGLDMNTGAYLARQWLSEQGAFGPLVTPEVPAPPQGSLPWYLSLASHPHCFIDFRAAQRSASIAAWLAKPLQMHSMGGAYMDPPLLYTQMTPALGFDGMIFVDRTTPTTPTAHARSLATSTSGE